MRRRCCCRRLAGAAAAAGIDDRVTHGYADSNGVKIHYASLGAGPLVVMIHGFPDYWHTWRRQMEGLADRFQVVAIDQRGYNLSDRPAGVENYDLRLLVGDVIAVIKHLGQQKAIVVGHDWGGMAWQLAMNAPDVVERLIILNLPHPRGLLRELRPQPGSAEEQRLRQAIPGRRRREDIDRGGLAGWVKDAEARPKLTSRRSASRTSARCSTTTRETTRANRTRKIRRR